INANFFQNYSAITFSTFVDASQPSNAADFQATLFTPTGGVQGRLDLHTLIDQSDTADIRLTGQVVPTGHPGPPAPPPPIAQSPPADLRPPGQVVPTGHPGPTSTETGPTGITIFHNVPLGTGGFLTLFSRTQTPITSSGTPVGPGAGLA